MTEDAEKPKTDEPEPQPRPRGAATTVVAWIALIIAALAFGGGLYLEKEREKLKDRIADLRTALHETERDLARRDADFVRAESLQRLDSEIDRRIIELERRLQQSDAGMEYLRDQVEGASSDWILAEVEYVLRLALQHAMVERDPDVALVALRAAERRLREYGQPEVRPVIEQLGQDIGALERVTVPDRAGIALTLDAIANRVDELPLVRSEFEREWRIRRDGTKRLGVDWHALWQRVRQSFHSMVTIRRGERPTATLLPADQEVIVYLNTRLKIEGAKLALMQRDATAYRAGLRGARNWIGTWFDVEDDTVAAMTGELEALERYDIDPALPDISGSLQALRAVRGGR